MQTTISTLQLACFAVVVLLCVWETRLIYLISLHGSRRSLKQSCRGLASMIVLVTVWGVSIGWSLNSDLTAKIYEQERTIQQLTFDRMPSEYAKSIAYMDLQADAGRDADSSVAQTITVSLQDGPVVSWNRNDTGGDVSCGRGRSDEGSGGIQGRVPPAAIHHRGIDSLQRKKWFGSRDF